MRKKMDNMTNTHTPEYGPCGPVILGGAIGSCAKELEGKLCPYCADGTNTLAALAAIAKAEVR